MRRPRQVAAVPTAGLLLWALAGGAAAAPSPGAPAADATTIIVKLETAGTCPQPTLAIYSGTSSTKIGEFKAGAGTAIKAETTEKGTKSLEITAGVSGLNTANSLPLRIVFTDTACPLVAEPEVRLSGSPEPELLKTCAVSPVFWVGGGNCSSFAPRPLPPAETVADEKTCPTVPSAEAPADDPKNDQNAVKPVTPVPPDPTLVDRLLSAPWLIGLSALTFLIATTVLVITNLAGARQLRAATTLRATLKEIGGDVVSIKTSMQALMTNAPKPPDGTPAIAPPPPSPPQPPPAWDLYSPPPPPPAVQPPTQPAEPPPMPEPEPPLANSAPTSLQSFVAALSRGYMEGVKGRAEAKTFAESTGVIAYNLHPDNPGWLQLAARDPMTDVDFWAIQAGDDRYLLFPSFHSVANQFSLRTADALGAKQLYGEFFDIATPGNELTVQAPATARPIGDRILECTLRGRFSL